MALTVYRFRSVSELDDRWLRSVVNGSPYVSAETGGKVEDITVDSAEGADLVAAMATRGYTLVSTNPATPPENDFLPVSTGFDEDRILTTLDAHVVINRSTGNVLVRRP